MDNKTMLNKMIFNKRLNLINKTNCFFQETPSIDKITFRDDESLLCMNENKENISDLVNKTIKIKEKTISNMSNIFSSHPSIEKFEKSTPGFNKHQKKLDTQEMHMINEKPASPSKKYILSEKSIDRDQENSKIAANRLKKNKKATSCLWESSNLSFDNVQNMSIESHKESMKTKFDMKTTSNLNISNNMARKLKLPTNNFWKKFIGKNNGNSKILNSKDEKDIIQQEFSIYNKTSNKNHVNVKPKEENSIYNNTNNKNHMNAKSNNSKEDENDRKNSNINENNDIEWLKNEVIALKERVTNLENSEQKLKENTEKLDKKYRKLKKEKDSLKRMNTYLVEQNKGILLDLKEVSSKTQNKSFETVLKSLNEFEVKLKNSIACSNKLIIT